METSRDGEAFLTQLRQDLDRIVLTLSSTKDNYCEESARVVASYLTRRHLPAEEGKK